MQLIGQKLKTFFFFGLNKPTKWVKFSIFTVEYEIDLQIMKIIYIQRFVVFKLKEKRDKH